MRPREKAFTAPGVARTLLGAATLSKNRSSGVEMKHTYAAVWALVVVSIFCLSTPLQAQRADRAIITGVVTDTTGASVAGATVKVHDEGTGVETNLSTNAAGAYTTPESRNRIGFTAAAVGHIKAVASVGHTNTLVWSPYVRSARKSGKAP